MELSEYVYPEKCSEVIKCFYEEILFGHEYDRYFKIEPHDTVIDCGAFVGLFTNYALSQGARTVISVECELEYWKCLIKNVKSYDAQILFGRVFQDDIPTTNPDVAPSYSIEGIMNLKNLHKVDMVKMDIEGAEWGVLINMDDDVMKRVDRWAIEVHLKWADNNTVWAGHGRDFDGHRLSKLVFIMEKFSKNGFKINYEQIHKKYNIAMLYAYK
jgi:hypothetical protein